MAKAVWDFLSQYIDFIQKVIFFKIQDSNPIEFTHCFIYMKQRSVGCKKKNCRCHHIDSKFIFGFITNLRI